MQVKNLLRDWQDVVNIFAFCWCAGWTCVGFFKNDPIAGLSVSAGIATLYAAGSFAAAKCGLHKRLLQVALATFLVTILGVHTQMGLVAGSTESKSIIILALVSFSLLIGTSIWQD